MVLQARLQPKHFYIAAVIYDSEMLVMSDVRLMHDGLMPHILRTTTTNVNDQI